MHLINIKCDDKESFKYSTLLFLNYYNIKNNHSRVMLIDNNLFPYIHIKFNKNNDFNLSAIMTLWSCLSPILTVSLYF